MTKTEVSALAKQVGTLAKGRSVLLRTAESCTGGMLAAVLSEAAGASAWFECGFVCYSNAAKMRMLGVSAEVLARYGAVSEEVAAAMCEGAGDYSMSVTGIAGPSGGSDDKPVGTVCFAWRMLGEDSIRTQRCCFDGGRDDIRTAAVVQALRGMEERLKGN